MKLVALLEKVRTAPRDHRIDLRDPIAAYGTRAMDGVHPWLQDDRLAAFAVRVIERVGMNGEPDAASTALRWARTRVPAIVTGDVAWALQRLKTAAKPAAATKDTPLVPMPSREPPRYDAAKRRRPR